MQFPVGMGSGPSLGSGIIRAVPGQHIYQQQLVPQQFPFSGYVQTGQGTHQPINLTQPEQPAAMGMRPTTNPMMVYSEQHTMQTQIQPAVPPPQKKKSRAVKIIDPDTKVEVDLHSTGSSALTNRTNVEEQSGVNLVAAEFKSKVTAVSGITSFPQFTPGASVVEPESLASDRPPNADTSDVTEDAGRDSKGLSGLLVADEKLQLFHCEQDPEIGKDSEPFSSILPEPPMDIQPEPPKVITPPIQKDGKIRYRKDFLLHFQDFPMCQEAPASMKKIAACISDGNSSMHGGGGFHSQRERAPADNRRMSRQRVGSKKIIHQPTEKIHAEAAIEEAKEKEMIQHHHVSIKSGAGGRDRDRDRDRDSRWGSKDDHGLKDRENHRERERFDQRKLKHLKSKKAKANSGQGGHLGPTAVLRPAAGWKKSGPPASQTDGAKLIKAPPRSSTGPVLKSRTDTRAGGRAPLQGPRRSHTTPEAEKESLLQTVNEFITSKPLEAVPSGPTSHAPSRDAPAQAILCSDKRTVVAQPAITEKMIASAQRRVTSTIDELVDNKDYKGGHLEPTAVLRPAAGWKKSGPPASQTSDGAKSIKAPPREQHALTRPVSKSRTDTRADGRAPLQGPRRSHTTPEAEKESLLQTMNEFATSKPFTSHTPSRDAPAQAILCSDKRPVVPPPTITEEMIASAQQKFTSIIDELADNKDYKETIECVKEIDLPGAMKHVVVEGINHTLERKATLRTVTGELFCRLVQEKILSQQDFSDGLNDVLEVAEDIAIDIPKIWDCLGEVLAPVFVRKHISLLILKKPPTSLVESGWAAILMAKLLSQCLAVLKGEEEVKDLWTRSGVCWDDLGVQREDLDVFLERQGLSFLLVKKSAMVMRDLPPALLEALHTQLVSTNIPNDDISQWIKKNCADLGYDPALLVTNLTSAILLASVSGSGDRAVFNQDQFERRVDVVNAQGHYGVAVLHGLQYSVAKLSHPPKLLLSLFNVIYDLDIVDDKEFYMWRDDDQVVYGKGLAVSSVKPFFDWLNVDQTLYG